MKEEESGKNERERESKRDKDGESFIEASMDDVVYIYIDSLVEDE